jgi:hypothetical protein
MTTHLLIAFCMAAILAHGAAQSGCPRYRARTFTDTSRSAGGLRGIVGRFQRALGGANNDDGPGQRTGFRAINWDGAQLPFDMPNDAFKKTRGAQFFSFDNEFVVSNPNNSANGVSLGNQTTPRRDFRFSSLNPAASRRFQVFSPNRLFTARNSNRFSTRFFVPSSRNRQDTAAVSGFGAVFMDVDFRRTTRLRFFDRRGCLVADVFVPPRSRGLSFAGIVVNRSFRSPIFEVQFTVGTNAIVETRARRADFVVMDDFIFGEPQRLGRS